MCFKIDSRYDFTGQERDRGTGLLYFGARYYDPIVGRWLSVDRYMDKYLSWSPYHYVLNDPVRFTDITGDTVNVDPQLLEPVVYTEGDKKGQTKSFADMTPAEKQRHFFQQWWAENQEMVNELFGIGGKYETTNIAFKLSGYSKKFLGITVMSPKLFFGHTAWAKQGTDEGYFYHGGDFFEGGKLYSDGTITPNFDIEKLQINVYFNPELARDRYFTPPHEWKHVQIIFDAVKRGVAVSSGIKQHEIINQCIIPEIK
ncbi:MAG: hypothetical protein A4E59_00257 [Syntrophorhabdus sp. PtaB.Bin027]|nr:MAG: hypothetical protein A4E59_00257 [Syntrophorhabdus sp. PtaB.Bin027]